MSRKRLGAPGSGRMAAATVSLALATAVGAQNGFDFAPPVVLDIGFVAYPNSVDAGYIDGDPWVDLVLSGRNNDGFAVIFYGTPAGFGPAVQLDMGGQTNWAVVRDFNTSDGFNDLIFSHRSGLGRISVFAGNGTQAPGKPVVYPVGRGPQLLGAVDLDGDMDLDLVVLNTGTFDISVLANDGNGVFTPVQRIAVNRTASSSASPTWAQFVDVDGDGHLDIVTMNLQAHGSVSVLHNRGDGTFDTAVQHAVAGIETGEAVSTLAAADFDGDNDVDLVTKVGDLGFNDRIVLLINDGTGSFDTAAHIQLQSSPWDITTGDFDNDGHVDIAWVTHVFSSQAAGFLRILGTGTPDFGMPEPEILLGGFPRHVIAFDIDGDSDLDLIIANIGNHDVAVLENLHVQGKRTQGPFPRRKRTLGPFSALLQQAHTLAGQRRLVVPADQVVDLGRVAERLQGGVEVAAALGRDSEVVIEVGRHRRRRQIGDRLDSLSCQPHGLVQPSGATRFGSEPGVDAGQLIAGVFAEIKFADIRAKPLADVRP